MPMASMFMLLMPRRKAFFRFSWMRLLLFSYSSFLRVASASFSRSISISFWNLPTTSATSNYTLLWLAASSLSRLPSLIMLRHPLTAFSFSLRSSLLAASAIFTFSIFQLTLFSQRSEKGLERYLAMRILSLRRAMCADMRSIWMVLRSRSVVSAMSFSLVPNSSWCFSSYIVRYRCVSFLMVSFWQSSMLRFIPMNSLTASVLKLFSRCSSLLRKCYVSSSII